MSTNRHTEVFGKDNFGNETLLFEGETPIKLKLNPFYSSYYLKSGDEELDYKISNQSSLVQISGNRTKDSIYLSIINPRHYIQKLDNSELSSFHERILLTELQQTHGMTYNLDSILKNRRITLFGNVYFSDDENISNILNNNIQNTLLVYRILKADTTDHTAELAKMKDYFFERRQSGSWRNTFESAQIVETIIEDFIVENSNPKPKLILSGSISETIEKIPFERTIAPDQKIAISKSGDFPIYFTSYQSNWDKNPNPKSDDFEIQTNFENNPDNVLEGGTEVILQVNVTIQKDAEYVLINVPIPGGCSYAVSQNRNRFESHRENFKNEASIFCEKLPIGQHIFEIKLVPRYSGNYTLNPAKIEKMYFPTFNANNAIKKVRIK